MENREISNVSVFAEYLGDIFDIDVEPGRSISLQLLEAAALDTTRAGGQPSLREPFSLLFATADAQGVLPQATYRVRHQQLGELSLFLVPVGPGRVESIFN
jgi:hypothetical protein